MEHYIEYKKHRATARKMTRRKRGDDWDKFVKTLERDQTGTQRDITGTQRDITGTQRGLTGTQRRGFKIFKQLQLQERDKLKFDPITKTEWKEYYGKLWNEQGSKGEEEKEEERKSEWTDDNEEMIKIEELNEALRNAKNRKSCGLDNLPMELCKFGGNELKIHFLEPFNKIIDKKQMPQEWYTEMVINVHKKGTKSKCHNDRGITLLPTAYKLFANIITNRLNEHLKDEMVEEQCDFRKGRSCTDAIFTVQQIMEKRK